MKHPLQILALSFLLFLPAPSMADQQGIIVRQATVHADASSVSQRVGQLAAGSRVKIFGRNGGWKEVFSEQAEIVGWVRSYQVREGDYTEPAVIEEAEEDSRGFLAGLASLSRKASRFFSSDSSSTSSGTATIGVRGLSEAELKSARPDLEELAKMQQYASNQSRMKKFKQSGHLNANEVRHLDPDAKQNTSSDGSGANK
jgi:hypothetical protein